jgi:putative nucleotidyltransferase with HDIG domain
MLKKISVDDVTLGMHIDRFCGAWIDHPFWRASFLLTEPKDLALIRTSKVREVWIDCSKGRNLAPVGVAEPQAEPALPAEPPPRSAPLVVRDLDPVDASVELVRATQLRRQTKAAVLTLFQDARLGGAVNVEGAQTLVQDIADSVTRNTGAFISLARLKSADEYVYMHSVTVCALMVSLARQMGLSDAEVRTAGTAGLLHDVGKAAIPLEILNKPSALTLEEFEIVKRHPRMGHQMLKDSGVTDPTVLAVVLQHHEKTQGGGYPDGLVDAQIDRMAKMAAVCDVYDAITSNRPYKAGWDPAQSIKYMAEWAPARFDPVVFQAFVKSIGIYPIGSLVRLASARLGVVTAQSERSLTTPWVRVFFNTQSGLRIPPVLLDLSDKADRILAREALADWNFPDLNEMWSGQSWLG